LTLTARTHLLRRGSGAVSLVPPGFGWGRLIVSSGVAARQRRWSVAVRCRARARRRL